MEIGIQRGGIESWEVRGEGNLGLELTHLSELLVRLVRCGILGYLLPCINCRCNYALLPILTIKNGPEAPLWGAGMPGERCQIVLLPDKLLRSVIAIQGLI